MNSITSFVNRLTTLDEEIYKEVLKLEESSGYSIQELIVLFNQGYELAKRGE